MGGSSASVSPNRLSYGCPATIFLDILASAIGPLATPSERRRSDFSRSRSGGSYSAFAAGEIARAMNGYAIRVPELARAPARPAARS